MEGHHEDPNTSQNHEQVNHHPSHEPASHHATSAHTSTHSAGSDSWKNYAIVFLAGAVLLLSIANFWSPNSTGQAIAAPTPSGGDIPNDILAAPTPSGGPLPSAIKLEGANILGKADAPITIVEYSDFQCPFCSRAYSDAVTGIKNNYVESGKVKIVYKHFPLSFHPEAEPAALASECAAEQGKFWEFHDKIFENQAEISTASYKKWATELGLDAAKFNTCVDSKKYLSKVRADFVEGQQVGIQGTPGFFVEGELVSGAQPYTVFQQKIDALLAS